MTNDELLQQAKDQVAADASWEQVALLAIQSAREEAKKEGYKEGYRFGWENRGLPSYLHPTLAPDRPITEDEREEIRQEWLESGRDSPEAEHLNNG